MRCIACNHEWTATPIAKLQAYKKHGAGGCPACSATRQRTNKLLTRTANIKQLTDRGFQIISDWDGRNASGSKCTPIPVTVRQTSCGHTFTSNAVNLLRTDMECSVCGILERTGNINYWSDLNSIRWRQTAPEWKVYRSKVTAATRLTYNANKAKINPNNLPSGRAGTVGAYHVDHIVPVRWCFVHDVPPEVVADVSNLQMLPWLENVSSRDHIKGDLPVTFHQYL